MKFRSLESSHGEKTFSNLFFFQQYSDIQSRSEVDVTPDSPLSTTLPIIGANMNAVTGKRMSETIARLGGMGILPQDMDDKTLRKIIKFVQKSHLIYDTPLTLKPKDKVKKAQSIIYKRSHGAVILVNKSGKPIGIRTISDLNNEDEHTKLEHINTRDIVTGNESMSEEEIYNLMHESEINTLPVVNDEGELLGVLTRKDVETKNIFKPSLNKNGQLNVGVALGINNFQKRAEMLLDLGIDTFVLDTAHGFQKRMVDAIKDLRSIVGDENQIIAGNIMSAEGVKTLVKAGANGLKVGIGPGAMCTTRMQTGVGRPQFSAVEECATKAREMDAYVWADGGIKNPRDMALAIAAGATHVMVGSILSGTYESTGEMKFDKTGAYKENHGMASGTAVSGRNKGLSLLEQARKAIYQEGISSSKVYLKEGRESTHDIFTEFIAGLQSTMTYTGARTLEEFYEKALLEVQPPEGFKEGQPHYTMNK